MFDLSQQNNNCDPGILAQFNLMKFIFVFQLCNNSRVELFCFYIISTDIREKDEIGKEDL